MKGNTVPPLFRLDRHSRLRAVLSSYMDGEVSSDEAIRVEEHLATCPECRLELETLRMSVELTRALPELALPRSFELAAQPAVEPKLRLAVWAPRLATSAVGLLLVALLAGDAAGVLTQSGRADLALTAATAEEVVSAGAEAAPPVSAAAAPMAADAAPPAAPQAAEAAPQAAMAAAAPAPPATPAAAETAPQTAMAAAAPAPTAQPAGEAAPKAAMRAAAPPAAQAPTPQQADDELAAEAPRVMDRQEAAAGAPEPTAAVAEPEGADDQDGVDLPLRELQIAIGVAFAALLAATLWLTRRRGRLPV